MLEAPNAGVVDEANGDGEREGLDGNTSALPTSGLGSVIDEVGDGGEGEGEEQGKETWG